MQKGARTKASMKKLMQEQQITIPNGSTGDTLEAVGNAHNKEELSESTIDAMEDTSEKPPKAPRSPKKKKLQSTATAVVKIPLVINPLAIHTVDVNTKSLDSDDIKPGYTKAGKKIGRPRKANCQSESPTKARRERKSKSSKKDKSNVEAFDEKKPTIPLPNQTPEIVSPTTSSFEQELENATTPSNSQKSKPVKRLRKRPSKVLDTGDSTSPQTGFPDLNVSQVLEQVVNTGNDTSPPAGKRRKKSKAANPPITVSPVEGVINTQTSEISEQVAESVAQSIVIQPVVTPKSKPRSRRSKSDGKTTSRRKTLRKKQTVAKKADTSTSDATPTKVGALRLRSRSPKQGESPPLRISSPRAAKEKSSTPNATTSQSNTPKSRSSKEKDSVATISTPLPSPSVRGQRKTTPSSGEKNSLWNKHSTENENDLSFVNTTPVKRTRQTSKEFTELQDAQQPGRKSGTLEAKSSSECDTNVTGKRTSRRKSGSAVGIVENSLSSPLPEKSKISDMSHKLSANPPLEEKPEPTESVVFSNSQDTSPFASSRRRVCKKTPEAKTKSKPRAAKTLVSEAQPSELVANSLLVKSEALPTVSENHAPLVVIPKAKRQRKSSPKKGELATNIPPEIPKIVFVTATAESESFPVITPAGAKRKKRVSKVVAKQKQNSVVESPAAFGVSDLPTNTSTPKKVRKPRLSRAKQSKRQRKKSVDQKITPPIMAEPVISPNQSGSMNVGQLPSDLPEPSSRRRPSYANTNTLTSAKPSIVTGDEPNNERLNVSASPIKAQRRESRSISRDFDVSLVLTDIAPSLSGARSISNLSSHSLQSPTVSPTSHLGSVAPELQNLSDLSKFEESPVTLSENAISKVTKAQQRRKRSSRSIESVDNKKIKVADEPKFQTELQKRKADLEAEIALALLDLKSTSTSASVSAQSDKSSPEAKPQNKKPTKPRKRVNSTSTTRVKSETKDLIIESSANLSSTDMTPILPYLPIKPQPVKVQRRKSVKQRRASRSKTKLATLMTELIPEPVSNPLTIVGGLQTISLTQPLVGTPVKVTKTAFIPTASSLGINDLQPEPVIAVKSKPTPVRQRKKRKTDIVEAPTPATASMSESLPVISGTAKRKRKSRAKTAEVIDTSAPVVKIEPDVLSPESPTKKKRQRAPKRQAKKGTVAPTLCPEPVASTSRSARNSLTTSVSGLFPYGSDVTPSKKPTVFAKPSTFADEQMIKDADNRKEKGREGPTLKVVGGLTKFFRGGDEEEVDSDPRLPKDKAPLQTDNAVPWICSFCHLGPHAQKLGDLFGPYFANLPSIYGKPSQKRETWMHGDCALWAGRLLLVGSYLRRLEETLKDADKETCNVCQKTGATIGCLRRGCKEAVHFPCAIRKFWKMDEKNFHSYCPQHL